MLAVLALAMFAGPQFAVRQDPAYTFRVAGVVGDTYEYESTISMESTDGRASYSSEMSITERLTAIDEKGSTWSQITRMKKQSASPSLIPMVQAMASISGKEIVLERTPFNFTKRIRVGDISIEKHGCADVTFPEKEVHVGDTWEGRIELQKQIYPIVYKLVSVTSVANRPTAVIEGTFPEGETVRALEPTRFWVDIPYGRQTGSSCKIQASSDGITMIVASSTRLVSSKGGTPANQDGGGHP